MKKEDWKIDERCYHRNLKEFGRISSLKTGDETSIFVEFDSGDEMEVSVHLLESWIEKV